MPPTIRAGGEVQPPQIGLNPHLFFSTFVGRILCGDGGHDGGVLVDSHVVVGILGESLEIDFVVELLGFRVEVWGAMLGFRLRFGVRC